MGNRTFYSKSRNGVVQESAEYIYNLSNQMISARLYDGKHYKDVAYTYDADGNRIMQEEVKPDERKVELTYDYTVENRLKAVYDKNDLLAAMAYDGDGNRIFQLNYNLHTDDDWKGNSGNGNGNNKDNSGQGNSGKKSVGLISAIADLFTDETAETEVVSETKSSKKDKAEKSNSGNKDKDKGNNGNDKNNGLGNGKDKNNNGNSGNNGNTSTGGNNDNNGNANGNTNNTGGSQNQSGILFPIDGEVSELEAELIGLIKTTGKQKNYELVEYVNDVNREYTEVLMELNINGIMDTAYSYGDQKLTNERFTGWTGYYTYDPRGSVTGVTDSKGMIWQSYRYNANGEITFGRPQYNNVYSYNAESYNPNIQAQYLRARYYSPETANFLTEDSYLGNIADPLTLNRYNYAKSSPLNYIDPSGYVADYLTGSSHTSDPYGAGPQAGVVAPKPESTFLDDLFKTFEEHAGALAGGMAGAAVIMLTAPASAPMLMIIGAGMMGGAIGISAGGAIHKGTSSALIAQELKDKYGVDVTLNETIELDELPQHAQELCGQLDQNAEDMQSYLEATTTLGAAGMITYEVGAAWAALGPLVKGSSQKSYEKVKNWLNNESKGESGTQKPYSGTETAKLLESMPELSGNTREKLLSAIQDKELYKIANELYRPTATVGDGGTAAILRQEYHSGSSKHLQKATERLKTLKDLISSGRLGLNDLDIAEALRYDLEMAIDLFK